MSILRRVSAKLPWPPPGGRDPVPAHPAGASGTPPERNDHGDASLSSEHREEVRAAVNSVIHGQLCPLSLGLAVLYVVFAISHPVTLPSEIAAVMTFTAAFTALAMFGIWFYVKRLDPTSERVQIITAVLTLLVLGNSLLHLYLTAEPRQSTNILLVVVASGYLILSTRLYVAVLVLSLTAWIATVSALPPSEEWIHFGFAVFQATLISVFIHALRVQTIRRAEVMRLREVWRGGELEEAKNLAEEMSRLKSAFLANMSHEIRTPLTGILGFAEIMEEEAEGELKHLAEIIKRNGKRLLDTLNSVLDLSRLEAGKLTMEAELVNLADSVHSVMEFIRSTAEKAHLQLDVMIDEPEAWILIDPSWLLRMQSNLIGNAIKFTESGGVTVHVAGSATHVELTVCDTGIGISPEFLPYLFEEFRQESTGIARNHEGSGLGLAITHRLVELAGGTITVESRVGHGSTFTITFPRAGSRAQEMSDEAIRGIDSSRGLVGEVYAQGV